MKRIKYFLIILIILFLLVGIYYIRLNKNNEYSRTQYLMDTSCSVIFYGKNSKIAANAVFDEVKRIDSLMNMYDENSEISRINNAKYGEKIKISDDTYFVLKTALKICEESGGAFDITVGSLTKLWNFNEGNTNVPDGKAIEDALETVGYENIVLENGNIVRKLKSETEIDLGAAAKGYAGDRAVEIAMKYDLTGGIIDFGGNILCFGKNPNSENGKWSVGIQTPFAPAGTYKKTIEISSGAVVTGGTYQRYFKKNNKLYHHILNPYTGYPEIKEYNSVTVSSKSSLVADCLATAIFIMGEKGTELANKYNGEIYFE